MKYYDKREIEKIYVLLCGMYRAVKENNYNWLENDDIEKYDKMIDKLFNITQDEYFSFYQMAPKKIYRDETGVEYSRIDFIMQIVPIIEYIEKIYIDTKADIIQKVGALYNAIEDIELQKRCGDILVEATGAFDRVINQATQILEDRIKKKAGLEKETLIGLPLVSKAIHSKLENTILKFNDSPDIQEQYSALFKGIIGVYRNSTHHGLDYDCSREDALKFCAYIDTLLKEVEKAEKIING